MKEILFSVIIPTYNRQYSLCKAIDSVLNQSDKSFELIVVDDGSTDGTQSFIETKYSSQIKYFYQSNQGVCTARNYGAIQAQGKYLVFLDSDDWLEPSCLENYHNAIGQDEVKLIIGTITYFSEQGSVLRIKIHVIKGKNYGQPLSGSFAIDRKIFLKQSGYDPRLTYAENTELFMRMRLTGEIQSSDVRIVETSGVCITQEDVSERKSRYAIKKYESIKYLLEKYKAHFAQYPLQFINFKRIQAISAVQMDRLDEAKACMMEVLRVTPFSWKSQLQYWFISLLPSLAKRYYGR